MIEALFSQDMPKLSKENKIKSCELLINEYPDAKCALDYDSPYHLLLAVMLSAQTTDVGVNKITPKLFERVKTPSDMIKLSQAELEGYIKTIGLYRNKAKNLIAMSDALINSFDGEVPGRYEDLISLPGVGRKTANVMLAEVFGQDRIAVDTHVFRLANRIGFCAEKDVLKTEEALMRTLPKEIWVRMHHALIWHGRRVCKAQNPDCDNCCIKEICKKNGIK